MSFANKFDIQIVNDDLSEAVDKCIEEIRIFIDK
jgi:guanylate kinase